jgi:hypothetical protein
MPGCGSGLAEPHEHPKAFGQLAGSMITATMERALNRHGS